MRSTDVTQLALAMCSALTWLEERERDWGLYKERYRERRRDKNHLPIMLQIRGEGAKNSNKEILKGKWILDPLA